MNETGPPDCFGVTSRLTFDLLWQVAMHTVTGLAFAPDGRWLAGICDGLLQVWSMPDGVVVLTVATGGQGLAFTPQGDLAVASWTPTGKHFVSLLRLPSGTVLRAFPDQGHPLNALAVSPDGSLIAAADYQKVHLWRTADGSLRNVLRVHRRVVPSVAFSPDGQLLLTRSYGDAGIWALDGQSLVDLSSKGYDGFGGFALSSAGVIATSTKQVVHLYDLAGVSLGTLDMGAHVWSLAFDRPGALLATGFPRGPICITAVQTRQCVATLLVPHGVQQMAFAPDGTLAAGQDGDLHLWGPRGIGTGLPGKAAARTDDGDLDIRLERVRAKIARRKLAMNDPASPVEVEAFERRYGIVLPAGFRRFLLEVANGGEGPGGALLALGEVSSDVYESADEALAGLSAPFPLTEGWGGIEDEAPEGVAGTQNGRLFLVNQGCGMFWVLIVSGRARNEVWSTANGGVYPCMPHRDFLSWYEYWLDGGHDWWEESHAT